MNVLGYFPCCGLSEIFLWLNVEAKNVMYFLYLAHPPVFHGVILLKSSRAVDLGVYKFDQT